MEGTPTYHVWVGMRQRCANPADRSYPAYGGRGITVAAEWDQFERFYADMGEKPPGMSLGRIDNDQGYSKENCRWETPLQQGNNKRSSRVITHNGRSQTVAQWAREFGMSRQTLRYRIESGWNLIDALNSERNKTVRRKPRGNFA